MTKRKTKRMQYRFWLDILRDDEKKIADYVHELTEARQFAPTIRQALRLIQDLKQGNTTVLLELFPWVRDQLKADLQNQIQAEPEINLHPTLQAHLDQITALIDPALQAARTHASLSRSTPPPPPQLPSPPPEINLDIRQSTSNDENANYNMLLSTLAIGSQLDDLPPEVIEYGIRKGKLPASAAESLQKRISTPSRASQGPKPLEGANGNLSFSDPFGDLEDLDDLIEIRD